MRSKPKSVSRKSDNLNFINKKNMSFDEKLKKVEIET
jgi:hypothetical protein